MTNYFVPPFLEEAFGKDFTFTDEQEQQFDFYVQEMGQLKIPSGKIITCDPFFFNDDPAFEATFPTGEFPVQLAIAKIKDDERVGYARINFVPQETPVSWQMAITPGQDLSTLEMGEIFGYPVDAGTGIFMDAAATATLSELVDGEDDTDLDEELEKSYKNTWSHLLKERGEHTIAFFSTGWGDGVYPSFIGTDAKGNICRLVTYFGVVGLEEE